MSKHDNSFACQSCGAAYGKWQGRCDACGAWNTVVEEAPGGTFAGAAGPRRRGGRRQGRTVALHGLGETASAPPRLVSGMAEFDRAAGGGLVAGSALLVAGDPGIGKSTLLLQLLAALARAGRDCVYISGEEAAAQVQMRAARMGLAKVPLRLAATSDLDAILATLETSAPDVVVIDSIQTMHLDALDSAPGTVAQVRAGAAALIDVAKRRGSVVLLVGHVTKDGQIAGPRVLEHMVDAVLHFEGERGHHYRILRSVKNRFGAADEIGVFEMTGAGLAEVANPSELFLAERASAVPGAAVFAGIEGSRPVLCEIQALVAPTPAANPRRAVVGWDAGRLAMVLAVLDARGGLGLAGSDVYLNVAGGLRVGEPAADLAVAAALVSSLSGVPVPAETVVFGEIGLSGEVRAVAQAEARLRESAKLGFVRALVPARTAAAGSRPRLDPCATVADLVARFSAKAARAPDGHGVVRAAGSR